VTYLSWAPLLLASLPVTRNRNEVSLVWWEIEGHWQEQQQL
jgi:hypothetical protein